MTVLIVPNAWTAKLNWADERGSWSNTYGLDVGALATLGPSEASDVATCFRNQFDAILNDVIDASVSLVDIVVTDLREEGAHQFVEAVGIAGLASGDRLPEELCLCVTLRTALRSRAGRGRSFLSGFAEASNDATGNITAAAVNAATDYFTEVRNDLADLSIDLGVISRHDPAPLSTGTIRPVVTHEVRDTMWKGQRRRRRAN